MSNESLTEKLKAYREQHPHTYYSALQIITLVMIWFFAQGTGFSPFATNELEMADFRFYDIATQCTGGIVGALITLYISGYRDRGNGDKGLFSTCHLPWCRWSIVAVATFLICSCLSIVFMFYGFTVAAAIVNTLISVIITILFLKTCLALLGTPLKAILYIFFAVSLFRIVQSGVFMVPLPALPWVISMTIIQMALIVPYVRCSHILLALDQPSKSTEPSRESARVIDRSPSPQHESSLKPDQPKHRFLPWQFIMHVALFYFVIGIAFQWGPFFIANGLFSDIILLVASVCASLLFWAVFVKEGNANNYWPRMRQITFPLLMLAFLLCGWQNAIFGAATVLLAQVGYRFFLLSSYAEMFSICELTGIGGRRIFCIFYLAFYSGLLLGGIFGYTSVPFVMFHIQQAILGTCIVVFICLIVASCWLGTDKQAAKVWGRRIEMTPQGWQNNLLIEKCTHIAEKYQFTAKERETLILLAEGKNIAQIADALYVTKNTVRTHLRNLYNKLDLHSREEVLRFYEEFDG